MRMLTLEIVELEALHNSTHARKCHIHSLVYCHDFCLGAILVDAILLSMTVFHITAKRHCVGVGPSWLSVGNFKIKIDFF